MLERRTTRLFTLLVALLVLPGLLFAGALGGAPQAYYAVSGDPVIAVMVQLSGNPALQAGAPAAVIAQSRLNRRLQERVAARLYSFGAQELYRVQMVYNGIAVQVPAGRVAQIRQIPGVEAVVPIVPKQRAGSISAAPVAAPDPALVFPGGLTGSGVRIAMIDSGIDYTHAGFGGPGTPAAYTANNRTLIEAGSFPTPKVIGGVDFAGDSYDASSTNPAIFTPIADPDPLDCNGHGTHVASVSAGYGVTTLGATYTGVYSGSLNPADFQVRPGVAPEASLYAIKIFGCSGTTALLAQAIEYAVDPNGDGDPADRVADILNISLGAPFGSAVDPDAVAVANAVNAGMVVVAAAGDTNGSFFNIWSPATAPGTIAVAAHNGAAPPALTAQAARGPQRGGWSRPDLAAPGVDIPAALFGSGNGAGLLSGSSIATAYVAGAAALVREANGGWSADQIKALLMNTSAPVQTAGGLAAPPSLAGAGAVDLARLADTPVIAYATETPGQVALGFGVRNIAATTLFSDVVRLENNDTVTHTLTLSASAVVTEPGILMTLPAAPIALPPGGSADVPIVLQVDPALLDFSIDASVPAAQEGGFPRHYLAEYAGVLEIAPMPPTRVRVAHGADLAELWIKLDDLDSEDFLTATQLGSFRVVEPGLHRVRVYQGNPDIGTLPLLDTQFSALEGIDTTVVVAGDQLVPTIYVANDTPAVPVLDGQALIYFLNGNPLGDGQALDVYLNGSLLVSGLPVGSSSTFLPIAPGAATVEFYGAGQNPGVDQPLSSGVVTPIAGQVVLVTASQCIFVDDRFLTAVSMPTDVEALRLPFQIFPKSGALNSATAELSIPADAATFTLPVNNTGARNSAIIQPGQQTPLVAAFELAATSPRGTPEGATIGAADLRYVGVTRSAVPNATLANSILYFGLSAWEAWDTPNEVDFQILIDSTGPGGVGGSDGIADFALVNGSMGPFFAGPPNDSFATFVYRLNADGTRSLLSFWFWNQMQAPISLSGVDGAPFDTAVMFMPVRASTIGLNDTRTTFQYRIETRHRDTMPASALVDQVPAIGWLAYDPTQTALIPRNSGIIWTGLGLPGIVFVANNGGTVNGLVDPARLAARGRQDLLLLYLHNPPAQQTSVISVQQLPASENPEGKPVGGRDTYRMFLPFVP